MASAPSPLAEANHSPPKPSEAADPPNESTRQSGERETILIKKAAVKVSWAASTQAATTSQDAVLHLRQDATQSEAWLALYFPHIALQARKNDQTFFVFFAPEELERLSLVDEGNVYQLGVRLRRPPGIIGPNCAWTGKDEANTLTIGKLQTLGLEAVCTISVPAKEAKKTQLELFCAAVSSGSIRSLKRHYNTASLYGGNGGRRYEPIKASSPPSYAQVEGTDGTSAIATDTDSLPAYGTMAVADSSPGQGRGESSRRPPKRRYSSLNTEDETASVRCRKCDDAVNLVNQKMGDIMSMLTEMDRRLNERIDGLESLMKAQAQAREVDLPSDHLVDAVATAMKQEFVERDEFVETVAAQVDSEMDGVSSHLEEKLETQLQDYLSSEMRGKEEEILETVLERISSARVRLDM